MSFREICTLDIHGHTINMHVYMVNIAFKNLCGKPLVSSAPKHLEKETKI